MSLGHRPPWLGRAKPKEATRRRDEPFKVTPSRIEGEVPSMGQTNVAPTALRLPMTQGRPFEPREM
jgi:hypothetical protein